MSHPTLFFYPRPRVDVAEVPALAHAGAVLLTDTIHATGLAASLREALDSWTKPLAEHHSSKVLLDLALTLAIGGEHASDADLLRCEPDLFGDVASATTSSRLLSSLDEDAPAIAIIAVMDGLQIQWLYDPESVDMGTVTHQVITALVHPVVPLTMPAQSAATVAGLSR